MDEKRAGWIKGKTEDVRENDVTGERGKKEENRMRMQIQIFGQGGK